VACGAAVEVVIDKNAKVLRSHAARDAQALSRQRSAFIRMTTAAGPITAGYPRSVPGGPDLHSISCLRYRRAAQYQDVPLSLDYTFSTVYQYAILTSDH